MQIIDSGYPYDKDWDVGDVIKYRTNTIPKYAKIVCIRDAQGKMLYSAVCLSRDLDGLISSTGMPNESETGNDEWKKTPFEVVKCYQRNWGFVEKVPFYGKIGKPIPEELRKSQYARY